MINRQFLLAVWGLFSFHWAWAQGEFAGAKTKPLIGKQFANERVLPGLPGYEYRSVTIVSDEDDPEQFSVAVFQKGPTYVVLFTHNKDTTTDVYTVLDVLVIKQVKKNEVVRTALCRQNRQSNPEIVTVILAAETAFTPALRAWCFNRDKRRFQVMAVKDVDCMTDTGE